VKTSGARPFEAWLASICETAAEYEDRQYRWQHPVGYVSWPTLDPLHHPTEATAAEETAIRRHRGEKLSEPILEYDRSSHPFRQYLVKRPIQLAGAWVEIPSEPGLGVEVDRTVLDKFAV